MYHEEFDNKESENNEFVDAEYENVNDKNDSSSGGSNKPPKNSGKGPIVALIIAIVVIGLGMCVVGGYLMLSNVGSDKSIVSTENETEAEKDIGSTNTGNESSGKYNVVDVSGVVEDAMPSVVAITSTTFVESSSNDIYDFYFGNGYGNNGGKQKQEQQAAGSGFIVDQNNNELLIVTNNHVVEDADKLAVQFYGQKNKETVSGTIKGTNEKEDVAVISVKMSDIPSKIKSGIKKATLGDSKQIKVGNGAVAIGNALGFGQSVTSGVISAVDRVVDIDGKKMTLIQTDAPINGGNSGGALLNQKGEVIGINVAKYSSSGSSGTVEGMGFAIPISSVKSEIAKLEKEKSRTKQSEDNKGYLGIEPQTVDEQVAETYSMPKGVYVRKVFKGEAAEKAGIKAGDVITELDGRTIESTDDLTSALDYYKAGETVKVKVATRDSGYKSETVKVTLGKRDKEDTNNYSNQDNNDNSGNNYNSDDYGDSDSDDDFFSFPW